MAWPVPAAGRRAPSDVPQQDPLVAFVLALAAAFRFRGSRAPRAVTRPMRKVMTDRHPRHPQAHQRLTLPLDKAAVVQLDADARDVLVSNPVLVDAVVRTPRRIFLLATKVGQTNAFFFDASKASRFWRWISGSRRMLWTCRIL